MKDYYKILGVSENFTKAELSKKFKSLAKKYHPDVSSEPDAKERFQEINEAYETLSDEERRRQYDFRRKYGERGEGQGDPGGFGFHSFRNMDPDDFEDMVWGGLGRGNARPRGPLPKYQRARGRDIVLSLRLTFLEAVYGGMKKVADDLRPMECCPDCGGVGTRGGDESLYSRCPDCGGSGYVSQWLGPVQRISTCPGCGGSGWTVAAGDACPKCRGAGIVEPPKGKTLEIRVRPGTHDRTVVRVAGCGHGGAHGGPAGDVLVEVLVEDSPLFQYDGTGNVLTYALVDPVTAVLGGEVDVLTPWGFAKMTIPAGSAHGTKFRLKGKGIRFDDAHASDLIVVLILDIPDGKELSNKAKDALVEARNSILSNCKGVIAYGAEAAKVYENEVRGRAEAKT